MQNRNGDLVSAQISVAGTVTFPAATSERTRLFA